MNDRPGIDLRQLIALASVIFLAPALRIYPSLSTAAAGTAAWLSAFAALIPAAGYAFFISRFIDRRREGESMAALIGRSLGPRTSRAALAVTVLWFLLYAGFILRSGAERLVTTVYLSSSPAGFQIVMGIAAMLAALVNIRALVRTARMTAPLLFGVFALILVFALGNIRSENLLPLTRRDAVPILTGALPALDVIICVLYLVCFLEGDAPIKPERSRRFIGWTALMCLLLSVLSADIVGSFGAQLVARLSHPFFSLVRNLVFFRTLERIEALIVSLWVFPDFLMASALFYAAWLCIAQLFGFQGGGPVTDMKNGRFAVLLCAACSISVSLLLWHSSESLTLWSENVIPALNFFIALILLPLIYIIGRKTHRI